MSKKKIVCKRKNTQKSSSNKKQDNWKLLVVDDEKDVHIATKAIFNNVSIRNKKLDIISAYSGEEAVTILKQRPDIAMALIDLNMDSDNTGLELVKYIRKDLQLREMRIVIRTSHAGMAPALLVIDHYDIDDLKEKTELTSQKLYKCIRCGIKAYGDIMTSKEKKGQILHTERLVTLGTLAASVAHEINNPNSFISSNIAFLEQVWKVVAPILEQHFVDDQNDQRITLALSEVPGAIDGIWEGSRRIAIIIDTIKNYGKTKDGSTKQSFSLNTPISDVKILLHSRLKHINLEINISDTLMVTGDRYELSQVFINLFNNSMDAMQDNSPDKGKKLAVAAKLCDDMIHVSVSDNGPGIDNDNIKEIFEPFFTTKRQTTGTGLGLSIVSDIIKNHNGSISAHQAPDGGAEFRITLPHGNKSHSTYSKIVTKK